MNLLASGISAFSVSQIQIISSPFTNMGIHAFNSNSRLLSAVLASTNAQPGNGARQYENKCSHEGWSNGDKGRTWPQQTCIQGLSQLWKRCVDTWLRRSWITGNVLVGCWVLCSFTSSVLPDALYRREMALGKVAQLSSTASGNTAGIWTHS